LRKKISYSSSLVFFGSNNKHTKMLKQQFMVLLLAAAGVEAQRPGFGNRTGPPAWVTSIWSSRISAIQNQQPTQQPQQTQQQQPSSTQIPRPGQTQAVWGQCEFLVKAVLAPGCSY